MANDFDQTSKELYQIRYYWMQRILFNIYESNKAQQFANKIVSPQPTTRVIRRRKINPPKIKQNQPFIYNDTHKLRCEKCLFKRSHKILGSTCYDTTLDSSDNRYLS